MKRREQKLVEALRGLVLAAEVGSEARPYEYGRAVGRARRVLQECGAEILDDWRTAPEEYRRVGVQCREARAGGDVMTEAKLRLWLERTRRLETPANRTKAVLLFEGHD